MTDMLSDWYATPRPSGFRRRSLPLVLAACAVLAAACGNATGSSGSETSGDGDGSAEHTGPIRMNSTGSSEELVMWIAEAEGIFDRNDLDVEISDVAGAGLTPIALTNEEVDLGIQTAPDFLQAVDQGLPLTAAVGLSVNRPDNPRLFVVAGRDSGIESPQDLADARIGTPSRGGSFEISTVHQLSQLGVDTSGVDWVEVPFSQMASSLDSGTVDAVATSVTLEGALSASGHAVVLDLSEFGDDVLVTFLSA
ncbi:ABC transporter substrate-binding protein, partial [Phytoactinopolyspora endophytica]|uniref:ABC transporter substrate-binding protein n=1 Tax=Phytoactinopolyspora endophytica TaxID=1642495 RepID=UPI0013EA3A93